MTPMSTAMVIPARDAHPRVPSSGFGSPPPEVWWATGVRRPDLLSHELTLLECAVATKCAANSLGIGTSANTRLKAGLHSSREEKAYTAVRCAKNAANKFFGLR
jgi:hypothetical protein